MYVSAGSGHRGITDKHGRGPGGRNGDVPAPRRHIRRGRDGAPQNYGAPQT